VDVGVSRPTRLDMLRRYPIDTLRNLPRLLFPTIIVLSPSPKPLTQSHRPSDQLSQRIAHVNPGQDGDGPLLPLAVPVERDRDRAKPRARRDTHEAPEYLVQRGASAEDLEPLRARHTAGIEEREEAQHRDVRGAEERLGHELQEGCAEEDQERVQGECREGRYHEGYYDGLFFWQAEARHGVSVVQNIHELLYVCVCGCEDGRLGP